MVSCSRIAPKTGSGAVQNSASSVSAAPTAPLTVTASTSRANAGEIVSFSVVAVNMTGKAHAHVQIQATIPTDKMTVADAGGGELSNGRITWTIPQFGSGETKTFVYLTSLSKTLQSGDVVQTTVSMSASDISAPATAEADVGIGNLPVAASSSSVPEVSSPTGMGMLSIVQKPDHVEVGQSAVLQYSVTVRNTSNQPLTNTFVEVTFPPNQTLLASTGEGAVDGNHIDWDVGTFTPLASKTYTYSLKILPSVQQGDTITTLAETSADNALSQLSTTEVKVIGSMPQTGAEEKFFAPIEDANRFLTPAN